MAYDGGMTLSTRNYIFKGGITISLASVAVITVAAFVILPLYPSLIPLAVRRSGGFLQTLIAPFVNPAPYAPFAAMAAAVLYSLITMIFIYFFFEKTQAPEILFFAFFALSFAFEAVRVLIPLGTTRELPNIYLVMASRVLFFARYFGILSLFAASVYAAGLDMQKQGNIIFVIAIATLTIALGMPIDGLSWDSTLSMVNGYQAIFNLLEIGLVLITMVSFFVSAYSRGSREYIFIGLGSFLVCLGRTILLTTDTWVTPLPGLAILTAGTWFICGQLHRVYLWL
jgi:hypothetical protein